MITIFTATYNREKFLTRVYESLLIQSDKDFEWIVVDDGSIDKSSELIKNFINENKIQIKYVYTSNGGKHRAINIGAQLARGEWFFFLDSDDWLKNDAVYQIKMNSEILKGRNLKHNFYAVIGLCEDMNDQIIGTTFQGEFLEVDYFDSVLEYGIVGDKAWAVRTDLLKAYPFPEFEGEKFLTEAIWFVEMAKLGYKCRFYNTSIKKVEYLADGLSVKYYTLMAENWQGTLKHYNDFFKYMVEKGYSIMGFFQSYLIIANIAGKDRGEIINGIDQKVYTLYSHKINALLENL
ncbi:MAG: glycosyl transferase family 2 [Clostridia bacterium]|jgi:glycosyltransferase involved in cell wall biosynthesis|nr:glycosyl transferase family 2 [Clostridia bacterium]